MRKVIFLVVLAIALPVHAAPLPPWVGFPASFASDQAYEVAEAFGKENFPTPNNGPDVIVEGKHWAAEMRSAPGLESDATWAKLKPALLAAGWKLSLEDGRDKLLRMQTAARNAWMLLHVFGSDDVGVSIIEVAPLTTTLKLTPPAAAPETIAPNTDFPYIGRWPGSELKSEETDDGPMDVTTDHDQEPQLAGTASTIKSYTLPANLSVHQYMTVYRNALTAAGWTIASFSEPSDGSLLAHYGRNGRDVWAALHIGGGDISVRVADGSVAALRKQLDAACHVPLYGIHFDFNKATLRPDSEPSLQQVLDLLKTNPSLGIEVQGHTDNVGNDVSNQKLSEARAESVKSWLTAHGVPATRVTSRGYGKTRPVASNDNDEGRAKNRRVEIAKNGCK